MTSDVIFAEPTDMVAWIALAREVEPLFGPMADDPAFHDALAHAIGNRTAFCIRTEDGRDILKGGVVISEEANEIAWIAVSGAHRAQGLGRKLLEFALDRLDPRNDILVQTFDATVTEGMPARKLYQQYGFTDLKEGGPNPAGFPTSIMILPGRQKGQSGDISVIHRQIPM